MSIGKNCVIDWFSATNPVKYFDSCWSSVANNALSSFVSHQGSFFAGKKIAPMTVSLSALGTIPAIGFIYFTTKALQGGACVVAGYARAAHTTPSFYTSSDNLIRRGVRQVCIGGAGAVVCGIINYKLYQVIVNSW